MKFMQIRKIQKRRRAPLKVAVVLYGQQRFYRSELGILRTLRILRRNCSEVQISGHLWAKAHASAVHHGSTNYSNELLDRIEISDPDLIQHHPPPGQDENLVRQATSQRRAIHFAIKTIQGEPDLVVMSRTDLWIPNVRALLQAVPEDGEVWASNFHHSRVDDNVALLNWRSFQNLKDVDFEDALGSEGVLHGEHLRAQLLSRSQLKLSERLLPYFILRKDQAPFAGFALASVRMILRRALSPAIYDFVTSPKSEMARLLGKAFFGYKRRRI